MVKLVTRDLCNEAMAAEARQVHGDYWRPHSLSRQSFALTGRMHHAATGVVLPVEKGEA